MSKTIRSDSPSQNNDPSNNNFWKDILTDVLKELISASDNFDAPCKQILEGMSEAVRLHDNLGAARAFEQYQKCMSRPRPIRNVPDA